MTLHLERREEQLHIETAMMSPFPDKIIDALLSKIFSLKSMTHFFWSMASFLLNVDPAGVSGKPILLEHSRAGGCELRWVQINKLIPKVMAAG